MILFILSIVIHWSDNRCFIRSWSFGLNIDKSSSLIISFLSIIPMKSSILERE